MSDVCVLMLLSVCLFGVCLLSGLLSVSRVRPPLVFVRVQSMPVLAWCALVSVRYLWVVGTPVLAP